MRSFHVYCAKLLNNVDLQCDFQQTHFEWLRQCHYYTFSSYAVSTS